MTAPEYPINDFFQELLIAEPGQPALRERFICEVDAEPRPDRKYKAVSSVLYDTFHDIADAGIARCETDRLAVQDWKIMRRNAFIGMGLVVGTLRSVGDIYQSQAETPQHMTRVEQTTDRLLRNVYRLAFNGASVAEQKTRAYRTGLSPLNPLCTLADICRTGTKNRISKRSFNVSHDAAGQLSIEPRYEHEAGQSKHCPAVYGRVQHGERTVSALWSLFDVIGGVATKCIYPTQFAIIQ